MTRARELSKLINASSFSVDSDFNVGVNSTSPDVKLDVGGAVLVTGISTFENTTQSTSSTTGALIVSGGVGIAKSLNVGGNLSVAGTITYDDVTNVDSVGVVTARQGINVVGGGLTVTGVSTFFSNVGIGTTDADKVLVVKGKGGNYVAEFHNTQDASNNNGVYIRVENTDPDTQPLNVNGQLIVNGSGEVTVGSAFSVSQAGVVTATEFHGDASNLTNLPASGDSNDITASLFI